MTVYNITNAANENENEKLTTGELVAVTIGQMGVGHVVGNIIGATAPAMPTLYQKAMSLVGGVVITRLLDEPIRKVVVGDIRNIKTGAAAIKGLIEEARN